MDYLNWALCLWVTEDEEWLSYRKLIWRVIGRSFILFLLMLLMQLLLRDRFSLILFFDCHHFYPWIFKRVTTNHDWIVGTNFPTGRTHQQGDKWVTFCRWLMSDHLVVALWKRKNISNGDSSFLTISLSLSMSPSFGQKWKGKIN